MHACPAGAASSVLASGEVPERGVWIFMFMCICMRMCVLFADVWWFVWRVLVVYVYSCVCVCVCVCVCRDGCSLPDDSSGMIAGHHLLPNAELHSDPVSRPLIFA